MSASFAELHSILDPFEQNQVWNLQRSFPVFPDPTLTDANGWIQFVVVDKPDDVDARDVLPVIVAVGSNYYQESISNRGLGRAEELST